MAAPVTLVFTNVHSLRCELESHDGNLWLPGIERTEHCAARNAEFLTRRQSGCGCSTATRARLLFVQLAFRSSLVDPPVLLRAQQLTLEERGGISFATDYAAQAFKFTAAISLRVFCRKSARQSICTR